MKITLAFACDTEKDADIIAWAERQENKSAAIRAALRASWLQGGLTLGDVLHEIGELKRLLRSGVVLNQNSDLVGHETPDPEQSAVQALLDKLGI